jgi:L-lactate dehydrogenase complex protein LldF
VITPQLEGLAKAKQLPYASSLCGACREVCPVKIDIPELLLHLRAEITEGTANGIAATENVPRRRGESLAFRLYGGMWKTPGRYRLFQKIARMTQRLIARDGQIGKVSGIVASAAPPLGAWTAWRDAPAVAPESFRELWKRELKDGGKT